MKIVPFGIMPSGEPIHLFTLTNAAGFEASIANFGGIVTAIRVPDSNGRQTDVTLGFGSLEHYLKKHPYFGAITGRVAGRLAGGAFSLNAKSYQLSVNDPPNHLHGGTVGFDKRRWTAEVAKGQNRLQLSYVSPAGEEGYPGNVSLAVEYSVTPDNGLRIDYRATTDQPTLVNLTNHTYFNLAGEGHGDIAGHRLMILADLYNPADDQMALHASAMPVNAANDFRKSTLIGERLAGLFLNHGDHYVLRRQHCGLSLAARLVEPATGRVMEVLTTEPCLQFYTGKFLDGSLVGKSGRPYGRYAGLCLECQKCPAAVGHSDCDTIALHPGEIYRQSTLYRFRSEISGSLDNA